MHFAPDRRTCPQCGKSLSFKSFKIHKRLYYNSAQSVWVTTGAHSLHEDVSNSDSEPSLVELEDLVGSPPPPDHLSPPPPDYLEYSFMATSDSDKESEPSSVKMCGECIVTEIFDV